MIATTSFMGWPYFREQCRQLALPRVCCQPKSGIFLGKWHKKVAGLGENICGLVDGLPVQETGSSARMPLSAPEPSGRRSPPFHGAKGEKMPNRSWFYASDGQQQGPFSRNPTARLHRPRDGHARIRWSGPREWQAGSGPARSPAWSPAARAHRSMPQPGGPPPAVHRRLWRRTAFDRFRHSGTSPGAASCSCIGLLLIIPAPMGSGLVSQVVRAVRACAGAAESRLHGRGDDDRSLVFRAHRARCRRWL